MALYPDIRDLQLLVVLSQRKHFTRAATDCGISQPAFSARIRNLEQQLGVPIVRRGNRFLGFTDEGELVLRWAKKILTDAEGLRQDIEMAKGALHGTLVLGVVPTALAYAGQLAARVRERHPHMAICIQSQTLTQISRSLHDFSIDAGITYRDELEMAALCFEDIYAEQYLLLCPASLAPRRHGQATWAEAARLPLCLLSRDMRFRQIVDAAFAAAGVQPEPVMETNAFTASLAQLTNGSAAMIAPRKLVDSLLLDARSVILTLVEPEISKMVGLATLDQELRLPAINALRDAIAGSP